MLIHGRNQHNTVMILQIKINKFMEREMATHSSILAWKNPWTEESGGLKSMGLHD